MYRSRAFCLKAPKSNHKKSTAHKTHSCGFAVENEKQVVCCVVQGRGNNMNRILTAVLLSMGVASAMVYDAVDGKCFVGFE